MKDYSAGLLRADDREIRLALERLQAQPEILLATEDSDFEPWIPWPG